MKERVKNKLKRDSLLFKVLKIIYRLPENILSFFLEQKYKLLSRLGKNYGLKRTKRETPLIVSLTSFPARINKVYLTIETLLRQKTKPDYIYLWLSREEFPNERKDLPKKLLDQEKRGLEIKFCDKNLKSYNKLIHSLSEAPDSDILTVDDDIIYSKKLIKCLYKEHKKNPKKIISNISLRIDFYKSGKIKPYEAWKKPQKREGMDIFPTGVGGVIYPKKSLPKETFNKEVFMEICPKADDIWFKAMEILSDTPVRTIKKQVKNFDLLGSQKEGLRKTNIGKSQNDFQLKKVFDKYNLWQKLKN